jgi:hypothetical protein
MVSFYIVIAEVEEWWLTAKPLCPAIHPAAQYGEEGDSRP